MKYLTKYHFFIFPLLVAIIGGLIYYGFGYKPTTTTILINIGVAYILSPKVSFFETQTGEKIQLKWMFLKKVIVID